MYNVTRGSVTCVYKLYIHQFRVHVPQTVYVERCLLCCAVLWLYHCSAIGQTNKNDHEIVVIIFTKSFPENSRLVFGKIIQFSLGKIYSAVDREYLYSHFYTSNLCYGMMIPSSHTPFIFFFAPVYLFALNLMLRWWMYGRYERVRASVLLRYHQLFASFNFIFVLIIETTAFAVLGGDALESDYFK